MKIGIFSKFSISGGSEFRCIEMANSIIKYSGNESFIFCSDRSMNPGLKSKILPEVGVVENCFENRDSFYKMDAILVVNTDSKEYTTVDFWEKKKINLKRIPKMIFLFNFIVSPAQHLNHFYEKGVDVRIITGNERFFKEISEKDKHKNVSFLPRIVLQSPINPDSVFDYKFESPYLRIGKHSKPLGNKWNDEHIDLINKVNKKYKSKVMWDFMGGSKDFCKSLKGIDNVILRTQFTLPVDAYLRNIDVFLFFLDWGRQECWARSSAEALMSGCPLLATDSDGGNRMQCINNNNGFLCKTVDEFYEKIAFLIESPDVLELMSKNAKIHARYYTSESIIHKFLEFIK